MEMKDLKNTHGMPVRIISMILAILFLITFCIAGCARDNGNEPDESSSQVSNETSETAVETKLSDVLGFEFPAANRSFNILYAEGYMEPDFCVDLFDI